MTRKAWVVLAGFFAAGILYYGTAYSQKEKEQVDREFTLVNMEYKGTKVWVPGTLIVKRGEKVRIHLINNTPSGVHGFAIDAFQVKSSVSNEKKENVEFQAKQAGLFTIYCHLHPAHLTGQLWVIK